MLEKELYASIIVPSSQSPDGETPERVILTQETNGHALWVSNYDNHQELVEYFHSYIDRSRCLEVAVDFARQRKTYRQKNQLMSTASTLAGFSLMAMLAFSACAGNESSEVNSYGQQNCTITINGEEKPCH